MADPNNPRSPRAYDPQQHDDAQRGAGDPLAELARLIGQSDPFADFERKRASGEAQREVPPPAPDPYAQAAGVPPAEHYPPEAYAQYADQAQYPDQGQYAGQPQYAGEPHYSDQGYGYPPDAYSQGYDPYYDTGEPLDESEYQEQQEQKRRRRRLATVIAILALAVVGGAGAYGYRAFVEATERASPPPVIKADTTPNKMIPAAQAGDSASNKLIYDRVGEAGQKERVVPREERPVDIKSATVTQTPRVVYPSPDANMVAAPPPATVPVSGQNTGGQVLPVASEAAMPAQGTGAILPSAKKVRTVTIRPDMTVVPSATASTPEPATRSITQAPAPAPATQRAAPSPPPRQSASAPLSLSPGDASSAPPAAAPAPRAAAPARTAPTQPLALATPPGAASEPRASAGGSYLVQVSSQRSESDAAASYRALQARYPNVLNGRQSSVRRADLGSKGVYYRAMVGPFATGDEAVQFCTSLKAAGGQCIIHRN